MPWTNQSSRPDTKRKRRAYVSTARARRPKQAPRGVGTQKNRHRSAREPAIVRANKARARRNPPNQQAFRRS